MGLLKKLWEHLKRNFVISLWICFFIFSILYFENFIPNDLNEKEKLFFIISSYFYFLLFLLSSLTIIDILIDIFKTPPDKPSNRLKKLKP